MKKPTSSPAETQNRKADHLRVCLEEDVQFCETSSELECYRFTHCCLPELSRSKIVTITTFRGENLGAIFDDRVRLNFAGSASAGVLRKSVFR